MNKEDKEFLALLVVYATNAVIVEIANYNRDEDYIEPFPLKRLMEIAKNLVEVSKVK